MSGFPYRVGWLKKAGEVLLFFLAFGSSLSFGNGFLVVKDRGIMPPQLELTAETVSVKIQNQSALTRVIQIFRNRSDAVLEADFQFPLSERDTLVDFGLFKNGLPVMGENSDPAVDSTAKVGEVKSSLSFEPAGITKRVGSIAPGESLTVLTVYQTALTSDGDEVQYAFPLSDAGRMGTIGAFVFTAGIEEENRIVRVKTEGYPIVVRGNGRRFRAYFSQEHLVPQKDIGFSYQVLKSQRPPSF